MLSNREVVVSGLSGTCYGGCSSRGRTVSNYELSEVPHLSPSKPNPTPSSEAESAQGEERVEETGRGRGNR